MARESGARDGDTLGSLQSILEVASTLVRQMQDDPLLQRMMAVFHAMPVDDRPTIIGVLEREVPPRRS